MRRSPLHVAAARMLADRPRDEGAAAPTLSPVSRDVLSISLFGAVSASFRGRPIDLKLRKGGAILAYICLQENFVARRDRLAFLLWSESEGNSARTSLRQTLITLRKAFQAVGCDALRATKLTVGLDPERLEIDARRVSSATDEGRIDDLLLSVERLPETLLEGMEDLDEEFRTWLLPTRQALHNRLEASLSNRLSNASTSEPVRTQAARALLRVDPTNETALRYEVLSHARHGDTVGALRMYRKYEKLLATEYGVKPSAELQMMITRIQRETKQGDPARNKPDSDNVDWLKPPPPVNPEPEAARANQTIVIRLDPFQVQGIEPSRNYIVSAFRHALTASLVRFREWVVVDGRAVDAANSADLAGADYALQATIYEIDGGIEVVLTLLRLQDSRYPWSQIISLQLDRWLATQHEIVRGVAATLQVHISAERLSRGLSQQIVSATAFDQWLHAQDAMFMLDGSKTKEARDKLMEVARINPTYAPIFSGLAQLANVESLLSPGVFRNLEGARYAVRLARRAIQLDALDSRAHLAFGWALAFSWDFESAKAHMRLSVELNESDPWPNISAALFWAFAADMEMSDLCVENLRKRSKALTAIESTYLAQIHFLKGQYETAISLFERSPFKAPPVLAWLSACMAHLHHTEDAIRIGRDFIQQSRAGWTGDLQPTDEAIVSWVLQAHPVRDHTHWTRLKEGLRMAMLPVQHTEHAAKLGFSQKQKVEV